MRSQPCAAGLLGALLLAGLANPSTAAEPPRVRLHGPPLAGSWVQVTPLAGEPDPRVFSWAGDGSLALDGMPSGPAVLCLGAEGRASRCQMSWLVSGRAVALARPPAGAEVTGRILLARKPVAKARVTVLLDLSTYPTLFPLPLAYDGKALALSVETGKDGRFLLPRLAPDAYRIQVQAPGGRFAQLGPVTVQDPARLRARAEAPASGAPSRIDLGDLDLPMGAAVEVTVADSAGRPVAGARVAVQESTNKRPAFQFQTEAGANGVATFLGLPPGETLDVLCFASGYFPDRQTLAAPGQPVRCALRRPAQLAGKVVGPDGKAVGGATVALRASSGATARTESDGTFVLKGLRPGEHLLSVAAPSFRAVEREVSLKAEEKRRLDPIQLSPAGAFPGRVVDGTTGEPVAGAALTVQEPPGAGSALSDAEGAFLLETGSDEPLLLQVEAAGFPATRLKITPEQQRAEEPVEVRLLPGGRIRVVAWDRKANGPCLGCAVLLTGPAGTRETLATDERGEALSGLLEPGPYSVMVAVEPLGENLRGAQVKPGETTELSFGDPDAFVEVVFSPPPPESWSLVAEGAESQVVAERLPDGVFHVQKQAGEVRPLALTIRGELFLRLPTLPADFAERELRLPLPATQVHGVLVRDGEPLAGQRVELVSRRGNHLAAWVRTAPDGSFRLPHLAPGRYQLLVGNQPHADFEVAPGAPTELGSILLDSR